MLAILIVLRHMVVRRIAVVILGLCASGNHRLCGQIDDVCEASDVSTFDVETRTGFQLITLCKFVQHCVVVFRVVTHYMTNL
jgi:hypothetical protein